MPIWPKPLPFIFNISNMRNSQKRFVLILAIFAAFCCGQVSAQLPMDLSKVKVSELSDQQITDILNQGKSRGLNIEEGEKLALSMGLAPAEAIAFKERVALMNQTVPAIPLEKTEINTTGNYIPKPTSVVEKDKASEDTLKMDTTVSEVYGRDIFKNTNYKLFGQATDTRAPESYILGPGDELVVSVFGTSYANEVIKIDARGAARVKAMGTIYLSGLTFEQARKLIRSKWSQYYDLNNNQLEITLIFSRVIKVNIVGEVTRPGTYEFPALNSVFNALLAAGGPNENGSLRNIEVQRDGKKVFGFDTYAFLRGKTTSSEFSLQDNDYIVVHPAGKIVKMQGAVRKPLEYEIVDSERLTELIQLAGGLSGNAFGGSIQRVTFNNGAREVIEYNLNSNLPKDTLRDGDEIMVRALPDDVRNGIQVSGDINQEGLYTFTPGMRVKELIEKAGGLKPTAFGQRAFLSRKLSDESRQTIPLPLESLMKDSNSADNMELQPFDRIMVVSKSDFLENPDLRVIGAVRKPGDLAYETGITLGDVILQVGGLKAEADPKRIEVVRLSLFNANAPKEAAVFILGFELENGELKGDGDKFMLQPYDRIYVRTLADFMEPASVLLEGEFKYPGTYSLLSREERISDVIRRAGGLKGQAFIEATRFFRETAPGGQVLIDLPRVLNTGNRRFDYRLMDGDRIIVPEYIPYVSIQGPGVQYLNTTGMKAVNAPYKPGLRANRYVKNFGDGFSEKASRKRVFVVAANDKVSRTRNYLGIKIYPKVTPGATIYVSMKETSKIKREKGDPIDWNRAIENTTIKLTGLATLIILLKQL